MEAQKLRGVTFRQRRVKRGLSVKETAKLIDVSERAVIAYELGVDLQRYGMDFKSISDLNSKWTTEDLGSPSKLKRAG